MPTFRSALAEATEPTRFERALGFLAFQGVDQHLCQSALEQGSDSVLVQFVERGMPFLEESPHGVIDSPLRTCAHGMARSAIGNL